MLSGYQTEVVAFIGDGFIICPDCARQEHGEAAIAARERGMATHVPLDPIIRYTAEEEFAEYGLTCDDCHCEIVEMYVDEDDDEHADPVAYADAAMRFTLWEIQGLPEVR